MKYLKAFRKAIHHNVDHRFRMARKWSNQELLKFSHLFTGDVTNISAALDNDKEGRKYKDYFINAKSYSRTNFFTDRIHENDEVFLDLETPIPDNLFGCSDVVFNHTTLEHIANVKVAFSSLCQLSRDVVITVVPFLQQQHGLKEYNDYWRFTPDIMKNLYQENGLNFRYCSNNDNNFTSIYLFCIGYRDNKWDSCVPKITQGLMEEAITSQKDGLLLLGSKLFENSFWRRYKYFLSNDR